jgi:hypothetical protein
MILVFWNCRGIGSDLKVTNIKYLVCIENPQILLIQETKMKVDEETRLGKIIRNSSDSIVEDS